jgi:hypothetical protein
MKRGNKPADILYFTSKKISIPMKPTGPIVRSHPSTGRASVKTHSKSELKTMAAQAKALAQNMIADPRSQSMFAALALRLEQEAAELGKKRKPPSAGARSPGKSRQN